MTTIKIYDNDNENNYLEVMNCVVENDIDDPASIQIDIAFDSLEDMYSFYLSRDDAEQLMEYLKKQFRL